MSDTDPLAPNIDARDASPRNKLALIWLVLPLAALAAAIAWLVTSDLLGSFDNGVPPVEN